MSLSGGLIGKLTNCESFQLPVKEISIAQLHLHLEGQDQRRLG